MVLVGPFQFRIFCDSVILNKLSHLEVHCACIPACAGGSSCKEENSKNLIHHLISHLKSAEFAGILWIIFKAQHLDQSSNSQQIRTTKLTPLQIISVASSEE